MREIKMLRESENGHDEISVPEDKIAEKTNEIIKEGNWANIEKTDGTTETKTDEIAEEEFEKTFGLGGKDTKSVTATTPLKGG